MAMTARFGKSKDGRKILIVEIDANGDQTTKPADLPQSKTLKSRMLASSGGNQFVGLMIGTYPVKIGVNAYIEHSEL